jgi:hypothetical protein
MSQSSETDVGDEQSSTTTLDVTMSQYGAYRGRRTQSGDGHETDGGCLFTLTQPLAELLADAGVDEPVPDDTSQPPLEDTQAAIVFNVPVDLPDGGSPAPIRVRRLD